MTSFLKSLVFLPNNNYIGYNYPYWSLLVESLFYLICPLIFYKKQTWFYVLSILILIVNFYCYTRNIHLPRIIESVFYFYAFSAGIFTYNFIQTQTFKNKLLPFFAKKQLLFDLFLSIVFAFIMLGGLKIDKKIIYILSGLFTPLFILRILFYERGLFVRKYLNPILNFLGKISFSIYLIHVPLFIFFYSLLVKYTGQETFDSRIYWIFVLLVLPFGYVMYKLVEEKSLTLIKSLRSKNFKTK
jgi:peptidoglycan/LPS O-acetylase OafA/YrhL